MNKKFNVGQSIIAKDQFGEDCKGHIVLIMYDENIVPIYYCSMYPGALPNWEWVYCVDLKCCDIDDDGIVNTAQALNKFEESELRFADIQTERKQKLRNLKNGEKKEGV